MIFLFVTHGTSQFLVFKFFEMKYKREIRFMIKAGVPEDQLVPFTFHKEYINNPQPDFKWIKSWEFRYKGQMYDIMKTIDKGDSIKYLCIHDVKESDLFANLDKHIDKFLEKNPERKNDLQLIINSLSKYFAISGNLFYDFLFPHENNYEQLAFNKHPDNFYTIISPPPES